MFADMLQAHKKRGAGEAPLGPRRGDPGVRNSPGNPPGSEPDVSGGEAVYEDAVIGQEPGDVTLEMSQKDREDSEVIQLDVEKVLEDNLDIPPEGTTSRTNEDGSETITQVIYTRDGSGQVIGYTVTVLRVL